MRPKLKGFFEGSARRKRKSTNNSEKSTNNSEKKGVTEKGKDHHQKHRSALRALKNLPLCFVPSQVQRFLDE